MNIEIRKMELEEFDVVSAIANSSKWTKDLPYIVRQWSGYGNISVAVVEGAIAAYAYFVVTKYRDYVNLYWIGTHNMFMGRGISRMMIEHIIQQGRAAGKKYLKFKMNKKNEAKTFYEKLGFLPVGETEKEYLYQIIL